MTELAFVGRSLTAEGGQNPLEPAMLGCAVLSGAHVQNFREAYQKLIRAGGARIIRMSKCWPRRCITCWSTTMSVTR